MKQGFVALISVIVVGAIIVSIAVYMVFINLNASLSGVVVRESDQARSLAQSCSEYALQELVDNNNFLGGDSLSFVEGTCTYLVTENLSGNILVNSTGQVNNIIRKEQVIITSFNPKAEILSWQEVVDF